MNKLQLSEEQIDNIIDLALAEDLSHGDITTEVLIPPDLQGKASILIKEKGIVAGGEVAGLAQRIAHAHHNRQRRAQVLGVYRP